MKNDAGRRPYWFCVQNVGICANPLVKTVYKNALQHFLLHLIPGLPHRVFQQNFVLLDKIVLNETIDERKQNNCYLIKCIHKSFLSLILSWFLLPLLAFLYILNEDSLAFTEKLN